MDMRKRLFCVLGIALIVRIFLIIAMKTYAHPVTWEYENIANNMLSGNGFVLDNYLGTPYRSVQPLYAFLCAGVYAVTNHSYFAILLAQSFFSLCLVMVIFNIAKLMFGEKVAIISALLTALHPGFVYYDVFNLMPASLDALMIATAAWLLMKYKDTPTVFGMSLVGCSIGLGALTRGIIGALLPFFSVYFILFTRHKLREKMKFVMILWAAVFITIGPWIARNYIVHKELVLISSWGGGALYRGNNPTAPGTGLTSDGRDVNELWPKEVKDKLATLGELGQNKFLGKEALRFIRDNPMACAKLYLKKVYYFWWFSHQSGAIYPKSYLLIYQILYLPLLAFAVLGMALALVFGDRGVRGNAWFIIFVLMSVCLAQSLFYVEGRHRWLIEPLLMIFFSYGVTESCRFLTKKARLFFAG